MITTIELNHDTKITRYTKSIDRVTNISKDLNIIFFISTFFHKKIISLLMTAQSQKQLEYCYSHDRTNIILLYVFILNLYI